MTDKSNENLLIEPLLNDIYEEYGYDFRDYSKASIKRRINKFMIQEGFSNIQDLSLELLKDFKFFNNFVNNISVVVTEMFRDPFVYKAIRKTVIPFLKTFPSVNIWHAGCASGEEIYSLAIVLKEEGIYNKTQIFATDMNKNVLKTAKSGVYPNEEIKISIKNYQQYGGKGQFSDYYKASEQNSIMSNELSENVVFMDHNLTCDRRFNTIHFIMCRNVLIYFNRKLQDRVISLFHDSLYRSGFLCLGSKESLVALEQKKNFYSTNAKEKIYRRIITV
jgi:chemotaxis protein methyltransferase CheR